jgi:Ca2+-binding RTX toxin-like protein
MGFEFLELGEGGTVMAVIPGTSGDDVQTGTANDDRILASAGNDRIDGRQGFDTIDYRAAPAGIILGSFSAGELGAPISDGFGTLDHVVGGAEGIFGSPFLDVLEGGALDNRFFGFAGDDVLRGGDGDDRLDGGPGNDTLDGQSGSDTLFGAAGDDVLVGGVDPDFDGHDRLFGGTGNDVLINGHEMRGQDGDDAFLFEGMDGPDVFGGNGDDHAVVNGTASLARLFGGSGNDSLTLDADPTGSTGTVLGEAGDDTISANVELGTVRGGNGDDTISGVFDSGTARGDEGNDVLSFDGLSIRLFGGRGDDVLTHADRFQGDENFTFNGGRGEDVLRGGSGLDAFVFSLNDRGADVVENFVAGEDVLQITGTGLQFDDFDTNDSASLDAGDDAVSSVGNDLLIDVAAAADVAFVNTITVMDTLSVAEADVLIA